MNHDASSLLGRAAVILAVVSVAATTLNLIFGHDLHMEPVGLFSFGLFCVGYATIITSRSRHLDLKVSTDLSSSQPMQELGRPVIVREEASEKLALPKLSVRPCHALTIDLEDYFHTEVASQGVSFADWEYQPSRIEASTHRLLELLDSNQTRGTFFVLGWVAKRYPRLIREIHQRGHELGCHSLNHHLVCRMKPAEFFETTQTAKNLI